jgi:hypothetical protein
LASSKAVQAPITPAPMMMASYDLVMFILPAATAPLRQRELPPIGYWFLSGGDHLRHVSMAVVHDSVIRIK